MNDVDDPPGGLRERLAAGQRLEGIVVRTPSHQVVEVLAAAPAAVRFDVAMLDTEHAPFSPEQLDASLAVAHALGYPCLVRVAELSRAAVQQALDMGANGVVVPHVDSPAVAERVVRLAHYGEHGRGFSGSTRAGGWGTRPMLDIVVEAARTTTVVVQIEDPAAISCIDEIVAVPGVDAAFVGTADLAVALGAATRGDPDVLEAVAKTVRACANAGVPIAAFAPDDAAAEQWRARGATLLFRGTDQSRLHR